MAWIESGRPVESGSGAEGGHAPVSGSGATGGADFELIEDDRGFADLLDRLEDQARYAIDTEFHRERTYFPHVALVQIADLHGVAMVDALTVDLAPFARILDSPTLAVMHAARQDMEVLERACGTIPPSPGGHAGARPASWATPVRRWPRCSSASSGCGHPRRTG